MSNAFLRWFRLVAKSAFFLTLLPPPPPFQIFKRHPLTPLNIMKHPLLPNPLAPSALVKLLLFRFSPFQDVLGSGADGFPRGGEERVAGDGGGEVGGFRDYV